MAPPCYADLGKSARDLFNKGYNIGVLKVETTTASRGREALEFKTSAAHATATGRFSGNLDIKYKIPSHGVTFTEKFNTDNTLGSVFEIKDQFAKNLKLTFDSTYTPQVNKRSAKIKAEWFKRNLIANFDMKIDRAPVMNFSAVAERDGWMFGFSSGVDTATNKLGRSEIAVAKYGRDYSLFSYINNGNEFGTSLFHRVTDTVDVGAQVGFAFENQTVNSARFGLAARYALSNELEVKCKVNHESRVGIAVSHSVSDQLKLTVSTQFGITEVKGGDHKVGLGIEYKP